MLRLTRILAACTLATAVAAATVVGSGQSPAGASQNPAETNGTPEARAAFEQADALRQQQKFAEAASLYKKAAELDPRYVEAHWQYIWNTQLGDTDRAAAQARLRKEYASLAAAQPNSPVYHWALGKLAESYVSSEPHFLKAVKLDPGFARPYQDLALIADFRGDNAGQAEYLRKAAELNPDDPQYLFYYASAIRDDEALYRKLSLEVARRFPAHERGAQALYWLGVRDADQSRKIETLERLRRDYPPQKFSWSASGMSALFSEYHETNPEKALALARDMAKSMSGGSVKTWQGLVSLQENLLEARRMMTAGRAEDAVALLEKTSGSRGVTQVPLLLARAEARTAAGQTQRAYDELVASIAAEPDDAVEAAVARISASLKKSPADVQADMWALRDARAKPAAPFTLPEYYEEGKTVSLSDYKGRVVLVNFWYPACGPCRGEFPYLQKVAEKFQSRGFEILALNVHPEEDPFVVPYMRNNNFLFRPLRTTADWAKEEYGAIGMPSNYLVDHEGRIMFKPPVISSDKTQRVFERQVEQLLDRAEAARSRTGGSHE